MKAADRTLRSDINKATRAIFNPVWRAAVAEGAQSRMDSRVLVQGARISAGNPPVAVAATSRRRLRGGLVPAQSWHAVEFGADRRVKRTYERISPSGRPHEVTRRTRAQLPARTKGGRVVYAAFARVAPRVVSMWVQLIVRKYSEAAEKGS